ncbi:MAG TPA: 2-oxoacid:acceptor oxidoreductase family protein [Bacteroidota bacterium]|nr:2-oxoacid:acceptor oxidoreductase family protein [Bacteroidota bacterium]
MKTHEMIIAGFGGQGVLSLGQILAYAAMMEGKEVSWMPSYGPEMRGGTANCIVILSSTRISSPIVTRFDSGIVFNQPSLDKFQPRIKPGGLLLYEESSIINKPTRQDIDVITIPALQEAITLGKKQVANMVMMGAFLSRQPLVSFEAVLEALKKTLPERHHHLLPMNEQALRLGESLARRAEYSERTL